MTAHSQHHPQPDDDISNRLRRQGLPVTRENWIKANWGKQIPHPWTAEHEAELPEALRCK
jgi:hypothetical protein